MEIENLEKRRREAAKELREEQKERAKWFKEFVIHLGRTAVL